MSTTFLSLGAGFLWQEDSVDVGQYTSLRDGHTLKKFVKLLVIADGKQKVPRHDSLLLVVTGGVPCKLQDLCRKVFHDSSQVDSSTSPSLLGVITTLQQAMHPSNWKLQSCTSRLRLLRTTRLSTFSATRHIDVVSSDVDFVMKKSEVVLLFLYLSVDQTTGNALLAQRR